jgi:peptidoglycan/LPS O-acetylase OafA/YrhL
MDEAVAPGGAVETAVDGGRQPRRAPPEHVGGRRRPRGSRREDPGKRLDIQGLRMVAVMLVVLSHMFDRARGGLVGVDVFFVISGFLITGLLLRELQETSRISLLGFYGRRVRRIVPAATLVLVAVTVGAYLLFVNFRFKQTFVDAIWALLFAANWRFASEGTNYLDADGPVSPVQHYWSLSVEEQFYFVWPGLILLIGVITGRWWARGGLALASCVMGTVVITSLAYVLVESVTNPALAYFSSFARVWELGVGAMLAISVEKLKRVPTRLRPFTMWIGLIAIGVGVFLPSGPRVFPIQQIAIAVVGAAMVIIAGTGEIPRYSRPLTNRLSVYIGDISYSLYLWHWPVIIFLGVLLPNSAYLSIGALLLIFGLSVASYELFENPIRHSNWLGPKGRHAGRAAEPHARRRILKRERRDQLLRAGAVSLALATAGIVVAAMAPATTRPPTSSVAHSADQLDPGQARHERSTIATEVNDALRATEWPVLSPSIDVVMSEHWNLIHQPNRAESYIKECMGEAGHTILDCTRGSVSAPHTIDLVGDSTSMSYVGSFESVVNASNGQWRVELRNFIGCSFMAGHYVLPGFEDNAKLAACPGNVEMTVAAIEAERPDVVVVTNGYWPHKFVSNGNEQTLKEREESIREVVGRISQSVAKVIIMSPPPDSVDMRECYTKVSTPGDCIGVIPEWWFDYEWADKKVADSFDNVSFLSTWRWFCNEDGHCPGFVGGSVVRYDTHHLTGDFSRRLGPVVVEALSTVGVVF